jgi:DNA-binding PadR family transcriptional regulator
MNDIIILGMLREGPKHGYRLKQDAALLSGAQQLHNNTVYPLLKRYLTKGWITKRETDGERGQTRLLYELTKTGTKALIEKLTEFSPADAASGPAFRLHVGLFGLLDKPARERILSLRDEYLSERLGQLRKISNVPGIGEWAASTVGFVTKELRLERKWISQLMEHI